MVMSLNYKILFSINCIWILKWLLFRTLYLIVRTNNYGLFLKFLGAVQETSSVEISKSQNLKDVMEKRSPSRADSWWMNLPYVLVS